jgi:hypothetical protein
VNCLARDRTIVSYDRRGYEPAASWASDTAHAEEVAK